jgi:hypothetical protein
MKQKRDYKEDRGDKKGKRFGKKPRTEEANEGETEKDELIVLASEEELMLNSSEETQFSNFNNPNVNDPTVMDEQLL